MKRHFYTQKANNITVVVSLLVSSVKILGLSWGGGFYGSITFMFTQISISNSIAASPLQTGHAGRENFSHKSLFPNWSFEIH